MRKPNVLLQITKVAALAIIEQADYYSAKQDGLLAHRWEGAVGDANSFAPENAGTGLAL